MKRPFNRAFVVLVCCALWGGLVTGVPRAQAQAQGVEIPVVAEGQVVARVPVRADGAVDGRPLMLWVETYMTMEAMKSFRTLVAAQAYRLPVDFAAAGVGLHYDAQQAVWLLQADPARLKRRDISIKSPVLSPADTPITAAAVSGFINLRGGMEYVRDGQGVDGRQPLRLDLDGAINLRGTVLEAQGDYLEDDARTWRRGDVRLVRDWPDAMVRAAAGDLSYPVAAFQSYQPMLGVSVARNFSLQPYRVTVPTGDTSFVLRTPSRVDIIVNGQRIRSLTLSPGSYDIRDFPVADGSNDVTLHITDATGTVEQKTFPLVSDQQLLKKGLHAYSYNAGVRSDQSGRTISYDTQNPVVSAFHRYGVTDQVTIGASAQGDEGVQQAGVSALAASGIGTFGLDVAGSHARGYDPDMAAQLSYRYSDIVARQDFSAQLRWRGADFAALGQDDPFNPAAWEGAVRYNRTIFDDISAGIGGRYRLGRGAAADDWSYSVNAAKTFNRHITVSVTAEHRRQEGAGAYVTLSWTPPATRHSITATADSFAGTQETRWHYRADRDVGALQAEAGIVRQDGGGAQGTGRLSYRGYRGDVTVRHDVTHDWNSQSEQRSQILAGTALAFADGQIALSRPITGSFVMLARHPTLQGHDVGINPALDAQTDTASYQARIDALGPAVLPDATAYMYYPVRVDTRLLPAGYDVGRDLYTVLPSYRSGAVVTVGHAANISVTGTLQDATGVPVGLRGGMIYHHAAAASDAQEFFTNADGRFRISRLQAGRYDLVLHGSDTSSAQIDIPQQPAGSVFDAGSVVMTGDVP